MRNSSRDSARKANDNATREQGDASLIAGNVKIHGRRTSVRLEPEMWSALYDVAAMEGMTIHDVCSAVDDCKLDGESFSSALRVFLLKYYRAAVRDAGRLARMEKRIRGSEKPPAGKDE